MRMPVVVFTAFMLFGCSSYESAPTGPTPPPLPSVPAPTNSLAMFWGMVVEVGSQFCIKGAKVEVVQGERAGETVVQEPCSVWDYVGGFEFRNLTPGVDMTLRASAPGYVTKDFSVVPFSGPIQAAVLEISRVTATVRAIVVDSGGPCIEGGTVEVVRGQRAGESFPNAVFHTSDGRAVPCDYWEGPDIHLDNLTPGEEMTLRGSAPGYEAQEKTVVPTLDRQIRVAFVLLPTP